MMTWNVSYHCSNRLKNDQFKSGIGFVLFSFSALTLIFFQPLDLSAHNREHGWYSSGFYAENKALHRSISTSGSNWQTYAYLAGPFHMSVNSPEANRDTVPEPSSVMRKSMILPGWGQVVNRQIWKVPIIYGMLAGLTYYSILMDNSYRDYRAAYYNSQSINGDERFGPTPSYVDPNQNPESLRHIRNLYRNRRDLTFVGVVLAYGLNVVDAYVFAHMRDFDVSDDLSARFYLEPAVMQGTAASNESSGTIVKGMDGVIFTLKIKLP